MKKLPAICIFITVVNFSFSANAQDGSPDPVSNYKFGIGIRLSNASPTLNNSITAKYFMNSGNALEGLLSFGSRFGIGGLYEIHKPLNMEGLQWYYGAGGYLGFESNYTYLVPQAQSAWITNSLPSH